MFNLKMNITYSFQRACYFKAVCGLQLNVDEEQEQEPPRSFLGHRWLKRENVMLQENLLKSSVPRVLGLRPCLLNSQFNLFGLASMFWRLHIISTFICILCAD